MQSLVRNTNENGPYSSFRSEGQNIMCDDCESLLIAHHTQMMPVSFYFYLIDFLLIFPQPPFTRLLLFL